MNKQDKQAKKEILKAMRDSIEVSANGGQRGTGARLDLSTVTVYLNVAAGVGVWNGFGFKKTKSGAIRKQFLCGGVPLYVEGENRRSVYRLDDLRAMLGNGNRLTSQEVTG